MMIVFCGSLLKKKKTWKKPYVFGHLHFRKRERETQYLLISEKCNNNSNNTDMCN